MHNMGGWSPVVETNGKIRPHLEGIICSSQQSLSRLLLTGEACWSSACRTGSSANQLGLCGIDKS
jgi:hypothetical protein